MVSHVVLFTPRAALTPAQRAELVEAFDAALRDIPTIRGARISRRIAHGAGYEGSAPGSADYLVVIDFDDLASLQAYLRHPAHADLGRRFGQSVSSALVYDFEQIALEELAGATKARD